MKRAGLKLAEVTWLDAHSAGGAERWVDHDHFEKSFGEGTLCNSVGYVFSTNRATIALAASVSFDGGKIDQVSGTIVIPRGMIKSIHYLK